MNANVTWAGQPAQCRCGTRTAVATLEETMDCPYAWLEVPGAGWVHTRWLRDRSYRASRSDYAPLCLPAVQHPGGAR